jgi:hypothetical protein
MYSSRRNVHFGNVWPPSHGPNKSSTSAPKPTNPLGIFDGPQSKSRPSLLVGLSILHLFVPTSHTHPNLVWAPQTVDLIKCTEHVQRRALKYILDLPFFCDIKYNLRLSSLNLIPWCYWHEYLEGGKGGYGSRFTTEKKAFSRFTCLKKAISRKTRF